MINTIHAMCGLLPFHTSFVSWQTVLNSKAGSSVLALVLNLKQGNWKDVSVG